MSTLSKSPNRVARMALTTGNRVLPRYAHRFSPQKYTQPQLFACLVLKTFFKTDYRGLTNLLADHSDLRTILGLRLVPHFTTLQKASRRLLKTPTARRLFATTVRRFSPRRRRVRRVAFDSTGLDCGRRSFYYVRRRHAGAKRFQTVTYSRYAKLEASVDCANHLLLAVLAGRGPRVDVDRFVPLLEATAEQVHPETVLADAGYDSEPNHRYAREKRGVRSFIPALIGRPTAKLPSGRHRRRMKQRLNKDYGSYGQRWQVETAFSMLKQRLGSTVNGRSYWSQCRELWLLAISYNIMLLYAVAAFLQGRSGLEGKESSKEALLLLVDSQRGADGAQDRFVAIQFHVGALTEDQHGAGVAVETARPAGVRQIETEELHVVTDGRLAGHLYRPRVAVGPEPEQQHGLDLRYAPVQRGHE